MSQVTLFFPSSFGQPEMPPDAGHDKRESAPATIPVCYVFPAPKPPCPAFARRGNGRQDRLEANAAGGTPAPASHARMTMTATGLPSRRFHFPVARCAIPRTSSFSFPPLQVYGQCPHAAIPDGIRCHFRCRGKGKDGIRNTNFLATKRKRPMRGRKTSQGNIGHTERRKEKGIDPTSPSEQDK